jgi:lysophospholipase L1-like esterase
MLYALPGLESNLYFDNVVLVPNPANYLFDVTCDKGIQQAERWTFTPTDKDVGFVPFALEVRDATNRIVARGVSELRVLAPQPMRDYSVLLVGDSLTHASHYPQHLLDLGDQDNYPGVTLVGSHHLQSFSERNRHEGYGGWTANRFATRFTGIEGEPIDKNRSSPFLFANAAGESQLDFKRYCEENNGGATPDAVTFFLGCNDTFSATDDTIDARIEEMAGHLDALIAMVRSASPTTRIGVIPPVPPAASQDAFGTNYKNGQTRWQYKRNQHKVVQALYTRYGNGAEGVSLVPAFVNVDTVHNYPQRSAPWNARTEETGIRQSNGVHPGVEGYKQIGDSIFCWLVAGD